MRSISIGTQPMPPSLNATCSPGKRHGIPAHNQSAQDARAFTGKSVVSSSSGAPGERAAVHDDDPLCRQTTVPVSSHAREQRVPVVGVDRRQPEVDRVLREGDGPEPAPGVGPHVGGGERRGR